MIITENSGENKIPHKSHQIKFGFLKIRIAPKIRKSLLLTTYHFFTTYHLPLTTYHLPLPPTLGT